jgi:hypothetical protein
MFGRISAIMLVSFFVLTLERCSLRARLMFGSSLGFRATPREV